MENQDYDITEYEMPQNIKNCITKDFCKQFMKELHMIWGISLQDFYYDSVAYLESTGGWYEALATTCRKLNQDELFLHYYQLPWYDSDLFDYQLSMILCDYKLLLPEDETSEIARQHNIPIENIGVCDKCGNNFLKSDLNDIEDECVLSQYICKTCDNEKEVNCLTYDIKKSINDILEIQNDDYFICEKCGKIHHKNVKGNKYCLYCETKKVPNTNVNVYYQNNIELNKIYKQKLKGNTI
jgi:hypothetical protein